MSNREVTRRTSRRRRTWIAVALVVALLAAGAVIYLQRPSATAPVARSTPTATPAPSPSLTPSQCADPASEPFTPERIVIPGVVGKTHVLALPRDGRNVPSVPPTSGAGKRQIAWDRPPGIKPGSSKGNVLLNAHTWPDGSALGNTFLSKLDKDDLIIVRGDGAELCYRVDKKIEVLASGGYPPYYDREGRHQLALLVCSGRRLGPGNWTHRTIWFASPAPATGVAKNSSSTSTG